MQEKLKLSTLLIAAGITFSYAVIVWLFITWYLRKGNDNRKKLDKKSKRQK